MSLRIRRGTDAQRQTVQLDAGEIAYTTDTQQLFVGDGTTIGGHNILATSAGSGLIFDNLTQKLKLQNPSGITAIQQDTAPILGGDLTLNGNDITGNGNLIINGAYQSLSFSSSPVVNPSVTTQRARGTNVSPLAVLGNDQLNKITATGYSAGSYKTSSLIIQAVSARFPVTSTAVPGRIDFAITDGVGNLNLVAYIDADMGTRLQMFQPNLTQLGVYSYLTAAGGTGTFTNFGRYAGTSTAPTIITTGDRLHTLRFMGYDGTNLLTGSQISSNVYGPISTGQLQSDIRISCRNSSGTIIPTQTNTSTQIQFGVMPVLPTFAGTAAATAAVTTPANGMMFYDSVTHKITAYANGAWEVLG